MHAAHPPTSVPTDAPEPSPAALAQPTLRAGTTFGRYEIKEQLGAGGMGAVFRAMDRRSHQLVALKVLTDPSCAQRFDNEARIHLRLNHPHIVRCHESSSLNGHRYIAMEYVGGVTLEQYIQHRGRLQTEDVLRLFRPIAEAVQHLHQQGVVHCDLKSDNVKILPDGQARLLDFGIALDLNDPQHGSAQDVAGTLQYLAPEVLAGQSASPRSDQWSLGVLLYEMLTGRLAFDGHSVADVIERVQKRTFVPVRQLLPEAPERLVTVIERCLQADPRERWPHIGALLQALSPSPPANVQPWALPGWTPLQAPLQRLGPRLVACRDALGPLAPQLQRGLQQLGNLMQQATRRLLAGWQHAHARTVASLQQFPRTRELTELQQRQLATASLGVALAAVLLSLWLALGSRAPGWWQYPPEMDVAATQRLGKLQFVPVSINTQGGSAEVRAGGHLVGNTPFSNKAPVGARVQLTLVWPDGGTRLIEFEVRELASSNTYTYLPPLQ